MLMLILLRLPPTSIFRFLCVSKKWNYIILTPFFCKAYNTLRKKLGPKMVGRIYEVYAKNRRSVGGGRCSHPLFTTIKPQCEARTYQVYDKACRGGGHPQCTTIKPIFTPIIYTINKENVCFINSSNGLALFRRIVNDTELHILNPVTMREVYLDGPYMGAPAFALVCEHNMHDLVLNYKVVSCSGKRETDSYVTIQTFCSKSGEWTTSTPTVMGRLDDTLHTSTSSPLVVDDTVYWFTNERCYLVVYYVVSSMIQLVELPSELHGIDFTFKLARKSCDDDLWVCIFDVKRCCIAIWMMSGEDYDSKKLRSCAIPSDSWIIMHIHNCPAQALAPSPSEEEEETINRDRYSGWWRDGVKCWIPFVVRFLIYSYHDQVGQYDFNRFEVSPYMEALTLSSYTL